ncbi:Pycsar system effector family protein [Saccharopolyspora shandongensis]|uniref:Pycsar system effector family protein n=1 Tax=Saccharopolyspora shandongensis TaxID=418495 RepID=UPI0033E4E03D
MVSASNDTTTADEVDEQLRDARDGAQSLIARADTKAQATLTVHSLTLAGAVALTKTQISTPAAVALGVAAVLFGAALVTTLLVLLPRLGRTSTGITAWARMSAAQVRAAAAHEYAGHDVAAHVATLSRIAVTKFALIRAALLMVIAGLVVTGAALLL